MNLPAQSPEPNTPAVNRSNVQQNTRGADMQDLFLMLGVDSLDNGIASAGFIVVLAMNDGRIPNEEKDLIELKEAIDTLLSAPDYSRTINRARNASRLKEYINASIPLSAFDAKGNSSELGDLVDSILQPRKLSTSSGAEVTPKQKHDLHDTHAQHIPSQSPKPSPHSRHSLLPVEPAATPRTLSDVESILSNPLEQREQAGSSSSDISSLLGARVEESTGAYSDSRRPSLNDYADLAKSDPPLPNLSSLSSEQEPRVQRLSVEVIMQALQKENPSTELSTIQQLLQTDFRADLSNESTYVMSLLKGASESTVKREQSSDITDLLR